VPITNSAWQKDLELKKEAEELFGTYQEFLELQQLYNAAIKTIHARLEILSEEFKVRYSRNPIHHIRSRLKSCHSMLNKLKKRGHEISLESARKNLNDVAGIRVVCCYIDDVYTVSEMLLRQSDLKLMDITDYIKTPNYNGYRSLHLDLQVPIYLAERTEYVTVEVQIRTVAMDFWASLEHEIRYKASEEIPEGIEEEMLQCADEIAAIDTKMQSVFRRIREHNAPKKDRPE
jgi:putative GTP pyrophosphokinase